MKKLLTILVVLTLVLSLAACGAGTEGDRDLVDPSVEGGEPSAPAGTPDKSAGNGDAKTEDDPTQGGTITPDAPQDQEPRTPEDSVRPDDPGESETGETNPGEINPEDTKPDDNKPEDSKSETTEPEDTKPAGPELQPPQEPETPSDTPSISPSTPGFQIGEGGIIMPGTGNGGDETPAANLGDGSSLVSVLDTVLSGSTGEVVMDPYAITNDDYWHISNWFPGLSVADGTRVAAATPGISSNAHAVILFETADGVDADAFAKELSSHADPSWQICTTAESVQYKVVGSRILFVMSSTEIADAVIAAFNG